MEDNLYKASTERLIVPRQEKVRREKVAFERERPLVAQAMKILEHEISAREKIDAIKTLDDPEAFMREVAVNKQVCTILRRLYNKMEVKVKTFDKKD